MSADVDVPIVKTGKPNVTVVELSHKKALVSQVIPEAAVEAAAHTVRLAAWGHITPDEAAREILEAAAPHMLNLAKLEAWDANVEIQRLREQTRLAHLDAVVNAEALSKHESAMEQLLRLADDMESAISGGPEFIGRTGLRTNASERIRRILGVEPEPSF